MAVQDLNAIAFPILSEAQIARLGRYAGAPPKTFRAGDALFRCGDRDSNFFVIKSSEVELVDETGEKPKAIRVLGAGEFTGDVGHLTATRRWSPAWPRPIPKCTKSRTKPCARS